MDEAETIISRCGRLGRIRLNRPKALNSLTLTMVRSITRALADFSQDPQIAAVLVTGEGERGLCAGGDIRMLYDLRDGDKAYYRTFWREEYQLNAMIASFPKPYVVLMDGLVMGGGVGVSAHGDCRVVTERTRLAMPETGIGFIPDVGGTWLLGRKGGAGVYMALSGAIVSAADALHVGLADFFTESTRLPELIAQCESIDSGDDIRRLEAFATQAGPSELVENGKFLDRAMVAETVDDILARLKTSETPFARKALEAIGAKSPTSLKVTHALLKSAAQSASLGDCLVNEYRAACSLLESHDLYEGIRAAVVDKDRSPKWRPASLDQISDEEIQRILAGDGTPPPVFPPSG